MDPSARNGQRILSSISTGNDEDEAVVLVVGGRGGTDKGAALVTNRPNLASDEQGNQGGQWSWHQLSPMLEERASEPGLLLLGGQRVLVCGGEIGGSKTAEILHLPRGGSDSKGVWTLLTQQFTNGFHSTYLVKFNRRIIAVGELLFNMLLICQKMRLFNTISGLHFRFWQGV